MVCKEIKPVNSKEINPEYSLEGLMLKLKLQYFSHLMPRADSLEKTLMVGKIVGQRRRGQQRMKWLDSIIDSMDRNLSKLWETVKDREANRDHSVVFEIAPKYYILDSFVDYEGYSISSKGFLPTAVDIMVI